MDNDQDRPVRDDALDEESSSDNLDSTQSDNDSSDSYHEHFDSDSDSNVSFSADDEEDVDEVQKDKVTILTTKLDHQTDPNIGLVLPPYKIIKRNESSCLYQVSNHLIPGQIFIASLLTAENTSEFWAKHEKVKDLKVAKVVEVVNKEDKSLIIYQKTYRDLHQYCSEIKQLPETEIATLFQQVLKITADMHRAGLVLRDLKLRKFVFTDPENKQIVLETWEDAILLDDPEIDTLTDKCGCPTYVSPEIVISRGNRYSGRKADCWSLGVILYAMLTRRYPFFDLNPYVMYNKIQKGEFRMPIERSSLAQSLVKDLLQINPDTRISAEEALRHEWLHVNCQPDDQTLPSPSSSSSSSSSNSSSLPSLPSLPSSSRSFGNLSLPGVSQSRNEGSPNIPSNLPQNTAAPSTSRCTSRETHQVVNQPRESNRVPYPVCSQDHCVPTLPGADIDSS